MNDDCLFQGDGAVAALMRAYDWENCALGNPQSWPQSLRTAVSVMLNSQIGMSIVWGPDAVQLYNDLFLPILGDHQRPPIGANAQQNFRGIWDAIAPHLANAQSGQASVTGDLLCPIIRNGSISECYFKFSCSPIKDETGVGGVLIVATDTTLNVKQERRRKSIQSLSSALRNINDPHNICQISRQTLRQNSVDFPQVFLGAETELYRWLPTSLQADGKELIRQAETSHSVAHIPITTEIDAESWPTTINGLAAISIKPSGAKTARYCFVVGLSSHQIFDDNYRNYLILAVREIENSLEQAWEDSSARHDRIQQSKEQNHGAVLQQRLAFLRSIFNYAPLGITLATIDGEYQKVNKAFCTMCGYDHSEMLARNLASNCTLADWKKHDSMRQQVIRGETRQFTIVKKMFRKDNSWFWSRHTVAPVQSPDGIITHTVALVEDITEDYNNRCRVERLNARNSALTALGFFALQERSIDLILDHAVKHLTTQLATDHIGIFYRSSTDVSMSLRAGGGAFSLTKSDPRFQESISNCLDLVDDLKGDSQKIDTLKDKLKSALKEHHDPIFCESLNGDFSLITAKLMHEDKILGVILIAFKPADNPLEEDKNFIDSTTNILNAKIAMELHTKELHENQTLLKQAQSIAGLANWQYDVMRDRSTFSSNLPAVLGIPDFQELRDFKYSLDFIHADDKSMVENTFNQIALNGGSAEMTVRVLSADKRLKTLRLNCIGMKDDRQSVHTIFGTCLDITEEQKRELQLQQYNQHLKQLSKQLVDIQETERKRIAMDLHDQVGQNLTALGLSLSILDQSLGNHNEATVKILADTQNILEATTLSIEHLVNDMRPPMLEDWGLSTALKWYADNFQSRFGIEVMVYDTGAPERFSVAQEIAVYRATQEALNNVAKHSRATRVEIGLVWYPHRLLLDIVDNGIGFDSKDTVFQQGFGLTTMRERIEGIAGKFHIESIKSKGTRVHFLIGRST